MTVSERTLDVTSMVGILAGLALTVPAWFAPDLGLLAWTGFCVLVPSLLCGFR